MRLSLAGSILLLCVVLLGVMLCGCSPKEEPTPTPVAVKPEPTAQPTHTQGPPTPTPTPCPVRLLLPSWLEKAPRELVIAKAKQGAAGRPVKIVQADDPDGSRFWDLGLVAAGQAEMKTPGLAPWLLDSLHFYVNKVKLKQHGVTDLGEDWGKILEDCKAYLPGASEPPVFVLAGDLPGLPRTLQSFAMLAGATSTSALDSEPVAVALDFLYQLHRAKFLVVGSHKGTSCSLIANLMAEAHCGMTLGWESEMGWITDPKRSPVGSQIEALKLPRFTAKGVTPVPAVTRFWCWQAKDPSLTTLAAELGRVDPGPEVGGKWIGGGTDTAQLPKPNDIFTLDTRPGQDFRDTDRIIQEGWTHATPARNILKSLEIRYTSALSQRRK